MNKRRLVSVFVSVFLLFFFVSAASAENKPGVESFFKDPSILTVALSPSGKHVAFITKIPNSRFILIVGDTSDIKNMKTVAGFDKYDVVDARWVNDERLMFRVRSLADDYARGNWSEYAVNRDGTEQTLLIFSDWEYNQESTGSYIKRKVLTADYDYFGSTHDGSDDVIVSKSHYNEIDYHVDSIRLFRLNTKTLKMVDMIEGAQPTGVQSILLDLDRQVRVVHSFAKGRDIVNYRVPQSNEWVKIGDFDYLNNDGFYPEFFDEGDKLYVRAPYKGRDALYRYDLKQRKMEKEPFLTLDGFDFDGSAEIDYARKKLVGIHYNSDASSTVWFDPQFKEIQKKVDALFPQTINTITCGDCTASHPVLVTSASDRQPKRYYIYNPVTGAVFGLGGTHPDIKAEQMGVRDFYRYTARDGLSIPVYVTMPPGKTTGPQPTVVLVHGGPYMRGSYWEWEGEAQFLASRGYVVVQPEYRGSEGFGFDHFHAGWKQWGQAMQDDLADAVKWSIAKGWSDPKRVAIAGASYGGYATLMGLIKHPEMYRCGVAWSAVTDIDLMFNTPQSDATLEGLRYSMKTLLGDPKANADIFKANSPLANADRLTQPLLLAHGNQDRRVPIVHGTAFRDAVSKTNKQVEWVQYVDEWHGLHHEKNRIDFWMRTELFLEQNLKSAK
jgi:acetyl esterase/lipase